MDSRVTVKNHHMYIGGCDATELAVKYGTPLYVLDNSKAEVAAKPCGDKSDYIIKRQTYDDIIKNDCIPFSEVRK